MRGLLPGRASAGCGITGELLLLQCCLSAIPWLQTGHAQPSCPLHMLCSPQSAWRWPGLSPRSSTLMARVSSSFQTFVSTRLAEVEMHKHASMSPRHMWIVWSFVLVVFYSALRGVKVRTNHGTEWENVWRGDSIFFPSKWAEEEMKRKK